MSKNEMVRIVYRESDWDSKTGDRRAKQSVGLACVGERKKKVIVLNVGLLLAFVRMICQLPKKYFEHHRVIWSEWWIHHHARFFFCLFGPKLKGDSVRLRLEEEDVESRASRLGAWSLCPEVEGRVGSIDDEEEGGWWPLLMCFCKSDLNVSDSLQAGQVCCYCLLCLVLICRFMLSSLLNVLLQF